LPKEAVKAWDSVPIYRLRDFSPTLYNPLRDAQMEAARVWTLCRGLHLETRRQHLPWPDRDPLQKTTKGVRLTLNHKVLHAEFRMAAHGRAWPRIAAVSSGTVPVRGVSRKLGFFAWRSGNQRPMSAVMPSVAGSRPISRHAAAIFASGSATVSGLPLSPVFHKSAY